MEELEYKINGVGDWLELSDATDVGGGWYALDITDQVQHDTTFRPLQENNELVIQAKTITLGDWGGASVDTLPVETIEEHTFEVGDFILISGAPLSDNTYDINGVWEVTSVGDEFNFVATRDTGATGPGLGTGGIIGMEHTVTIDAQLNVRSVIQAILFQ